MLDPKLNQNIGTKIKSLREHNRLTQDELASKLNDLGFTVNKGMISKWENGIHVIGTNTLISIARIFNVSSDYLVGLSDNPEPIAHKTAAYGGGYNDLPDDAKERIDEYIELQRLKSKMNKEKS